MDAEFEFLSEYIRCYEMQHSLWDTSNPNYTIRAVKKKSYIKLLNIMKKYKKNCTILDVKKKINTIRSSYRRELSKIREAETAGCSYQPKIWWFSYCKFLEKCINNDKAIKEEVEEEEGYLEIGEHKLVEQNIELPELTVEDDANGKNLERSEAQIPPITAKKKKHRSVNSDELLELATKRLKRCDDYSQTLANVWASEFRLASEEQKFFAKKAIDDILFEARLGTLHRNSVKINESNSNNDYAEFNAGHHAKRESFQCVSPRSNRGSITIEHIGIESHENDD